MRFSTRNRISVTPVRSAWLVLVLHGIATAGQSLPVFLADNHAESFGWISRTFDVDARHHLVLVDAHSDASMAERSEEIREGIRRVPSGVVRDANVEGWRESGRIQAFNWIEPLLPRPVEEVTWLAGLELDGNRRREMTEKATAMLDGRLEVEPRSAGSFAERWRTIDLADFRNWRPGMKPVILAIDLDFFAGMDPGKRDKSFGAIWNHAMDWPGLAGVAFSVSRPWLTDDAEADALVMLATRAVANTRGAVLEIDASVDDRPDESLKAAELGKQIPRWDAAAASLGLRGQWLAMKERLSATDRKRDWKTILGGWQEDSPVTTISPDTGEMDIDGVWRFTSGHAPALRVGSIPGATGRVRWFTLEPARAAYDFLPETGLGKDFASSSGRWIHENRRLIGETTDFALAPDRWDSGSPGRFRFYAELETPEGWLTVPPVEIRLSNGTGFRGALSECFRMPYVFGIAGATDGDLSGVETGQGSDCSNFLIHAWRRNGFPMPWGDPGRLRANLETRAENVTIDDGVSFGADELEKGIAIDFGRHVAALWEDREPLGKLGPNDKVAHHLGGFPDIVDLGELAKSRPRFSVRLPSSGGPACVVKIAGDVVLAGEERSVIREFSKGTAAVFMANLEGVPSTRDPEHPPRYDFRFPPERLAWLKEQGLDVVSLANNHAGDAGRDGLVEALASLKAAGIATVGAGRDENEACQPWHTEQDGVKLAVFGVCLIDSPAASAAAPGVARLPEHRQLLEDRIRTARSEGRMVIVMLHGGDEYRAEVNDAQRTWARWLAARGVNLVAGAHPHVIQRTEYSHGSIIAHSLGNAVYPKSLGNAGSGEVKTFRLGADGSVHVPNGGL